MEIPIHIHITDQHNLPFQFKKFEKSIERNEITYKASEIKNEMWKSGYATASVDSVYIKQDTAFLEIFLGNHYRITEVAFPDSTKEILKNLGVKNKWNQEESLSYDYLNNIQQGLLRKLEDNGYPYSRIGFTNANIAGNEVKIGLNIDCGPYMTFDTIYNINKTAISKGYLSTYLGIKSGSKYNESLVVKLDKRLAQLPFLQVQQPSRVWFSSNNKANIQVFLKEKKVSKFDFLIGILPNNDNTGKILVTGEAGISLWNIFGSGEKIELGWKRLKPQSQELNIYFDYPYILSSPFGADINFELEKQDTSYLDLEWSIGLQYLLKGRDRLKIVINNSQTFLQDADTSFIKSTGNLPPILDQTTLLSGLEAYFEQLDYLYNPSKGWELEASIKAGYKKIKRNGSILQLDLPNEDYTTAELYDSLTQKSAKFELQWMGNYYLSIAKRQVIKFGIQGASIYNKDLLSNELFKIGGNDNLRGFDEESIFTSLYNITTLEYRYLLDKNAFLSLFLDWAYTESRLKDSFTNDFPIGFGLGLNFETKAGIFGVSYALGRQNANPIDFKSSKIHFGYVNIF